MSLEQVIDYHRQLIAIEMERPQVFQVFELLLVEIFELQRTSDESRVNICLVHFIKFPNFGGTKAIGMRSRVNIDDEFAVTQVAFKL